MNITPILVTRGNVPLGPILDSLAVFDHKTVVWNNGDDNRHDVKVLGRYLGMMEATTDLIYLQDDDCIVSNPEGIAQTWFADFAGPGTIVCNMPQEFRHDGYTDSALVGFGAVVRRQDALGALARFIGDRIGEIDLEWLYRVCDVPVTVLLNRTLVDVPRMNLPYATGDDRMYRQPDHGSERASALELAREVRDA